MKLLKSIVERHTRPMNEARSHNDPVASWNHGSKLKPGVGAAKIKLDWHEYNDKNKDGNKKLHASLQKKYAIKIDAKYNKFGWMMGLKKQDDLHGLTGKVIGQVDTNDFSKKIPAIISGERSAILDFLTSKDYKHYHGKGLSDNEISKLYKKELKLTDYAPGELNTLQKGPNA